MDRYERILKLHRLLKTARYPVALTTMYDELECSRATLYRDIAFLRDALGAPIESDRDHAAIHYAPDEAESFELPGLWLSSAELESLLAMHQLIARTGGEMLSGALAPLKSRIDKLLSDQSQGKRWPLERIRVTRALSRVIDEIVFRRVASSVLERHRLKFNYRARSTNAVTERVVSPQRLTHYRENWYVDAWDHERQALRSFALDRVSAAEVLPKASRWVADERWHSKQEGRFLDDGRYELRVPYSNARELLMDVLRYGPDAEIVSPIPLREEAKIQLQLALSNYES